MQRATINKSIIRFLPKFHFQILRYSFTRENRFLRNPSQSLKGKQENSYSSASRHVNNSLSIFSAILNSIIKGWKYRSRELLKAIFCHQKTIREQTGSTLNFLQSSLQVCWGAYIPYFKINTPIFCYLIFFKKCLNPQVRYCWLPAYSPWSLQNIPWIFSQTCISQHDCKKVSNSWC